jgi:hypothetical protein
VRSSPMVSAAIFFIIFISIRYVFIIMKGLCVLSYSLLCCVIIL